MSVERGDSHGAYITRHLSHIDQPAEDFFPVSEEEHVRFARVDGQAAVGDFTSQILCHRDRGEIIFGAVPDVNRRLDLLELETPGTGDEAHIPGHGFDSMSERLSLGLNTQLADLGLAHQRLIRRWAKTFPGFTVERFGRVSATLAEEQPGEGMTKWPREVATKFKTKFVEGGHAFGGAGCIRRSCARERDRGHHPVRQAKSTGQGVRSTSGVPGDIELVDAERVGKLSDIGRPIEETPIGLEGRETVAGAIDADEAKTLFLRDLVRRVEEARSRCAVEEEEGFTARVAVFSEAEGATV